MRLPLLVLAVAAAALASPKDPRGLHADNDTPGSDFNGPTFDLPKDFLIGAGTAALQIEGSDAEDGKSPSVLSSLVENLATANLTSDSPWYGMDPPGMAADSYHRYKEDVKMAKALKLQIYRFSVSWPRILPDGDPSKPNPLGVQYYNNLINELKANGIEPMITMNHFDYPLSVLVKTGGWVDKRIVDMFTDYADFLFKTFGDRVKWWTTVNEPNYYCTNFALIPVPGLYERQPGDDYKCVHHTILAHMRAYRLYEERYRKDQGGKIGAAALTLWCSPNSTSYEDIQAAERANLFALGSIYHPVVYGDYPEALRQRVDHYSALEGRTESRLPHFSEEEKKLLKGCADFLCFNAYMGTTVADGTYAARPTAAEGGGTIQSDRDAIEVGSNTIPGKFGDLFERANPWVLREAPKWIHENYNMPIFITENGWGDQRVGDAKHDGPRVGYHSAYLEQLIRAHNEENVQVVGYLVWSLLDSYEFTANFGRKFGLVHVDYEGGTRDRSLKDSAWFFQYIGTHRKVPKVAFTFDPDASGAASTAPTLAVTALVVAALAVCRI
ncbi:myrosinase 1-like [Thrips palmi]|uniref:Myrosinase 1-like n=1 Tax=Thrips palmi TaxID=161013 RepID=A0A6P8YTQ7_THRPL|nr:myrosinase 1-like [Thrips palmi]